MGLLNVIELFLVVSTEQLQRATASSGKKVDLVGDLVSGLKMQLSVDKQENNMPRDSKPNQRIQIAWNGYTVY